MEPKEQDVKEEKQDSSSADVKEPKDSSSEEEVFEGESRAIPYARFKEKALEARELKSEIERIKAEKDNEIHRATSQLQAFYESELAKVSRERSTDPIYDLDDEPKINEKITPIANEIKELRAELNSLRSERETERLRNDISKLQAVYPELDEEHVLVVKKARPKWSLDECAEYSHKYFEDRVKSKYSAMISKKKEAAKRPLLDGEGRLNIEPSQKPKTFEEAKKRMLEYAKQLDRS
ncbi:MAG: hypothetical protein EHM49_01205 [Deltaproteobacteria bacterium]|nr:MAG: hypothetical protein EHM49_01205 [Deltaproteobacteria bacterium]